METKNLTLVSLNPEEYENLVVACRVVNIGEYARTQIDKQNAEGAYPLVAQKTAKINARLGSVGEEVDTRPRVERNGRIYVIGETKGSVKVEGSMIVTNPDGEEYIVKPDVFGKKYAPTSEDGVYMPIAEPINYTILTEDIVFEAPWGGDMFGLQGGALNVTDPNDVYAIQNAAFYGTYNVDKKSSPCPVME